MASIRGIGGLIAIFAAAGLCGAEPLEPVAPVTAASERKGVDVPEQSFDMSWWSVDGGGASSTGGPYAVTGAVGQPEVGGAYRAYFAFDGGVWSVALEPAFYYDGFETGDTTMWSAVSGGN
jgi:hypothetical protein